MRALTSRGSASRLPLVRAAGGAAALAVAVLVVIVAGAGPYRALGAAAPGSSVRILEAAVRALADVSATLCVGGLAVAMLFTRPQSSGLLSPRAYRAVVTAGRWALVWGVSAAALVVLSAVDATGAAPGRVLAHLAGPVAALGEPKAWLVVAASALALCWACRVVVRWRAVAIVFGVALLTLLPPLCTGHSSANADHDYATAALLLHVPAAVLWLGPLVPLVSELRRDPTGAAVLLRRQRRGAIGCAVVLGLSGLVDAAILIRRPTDLVHTEYGVVVIGVTLAFIAVVLIPAVLRRRTRRGAVRCEPHRLTWFVLFGQIIALLAVVGASAGLARLSPPALSGRANSIYQTLIGYDLAGPPTLARLAFDWRVDVVFAPLALALAVLYLLGMRRVRRSGAPWSRVRTAGWLGGCAVVLVATSSGIGRYEPAMFSVHMAAHMLLAFVAPLLLVQGAPLGLAALALRPAGPDEPFGPREWCAALGTSATVRRLTHPLVALVAFTGAPFLLYFTGIFDAASRYYWAHLLINVLFLALGYLFAWPIVGVDPVPRPLPNLARLGMLLAATPICTVFGAVVLTTHRVIGNGAAAANMYQALHLPWVPSLLADQRIAGGIALGAGEATLFAAMLLLLVRWFGVDDDPVAGGLADPSALLRGGVSPGP